MIRSSPQLVVKGKAYREDYWPGLQINECEKLFYILIDHLDWWTQGTIAAQDCSFCRNAHCSPIS